ncbi:hypothetical protein ACH4KO_16955 [Streptomyces anulatus]
MPPTGTPAESEIDPRIAKAVTKRVGHAAPWTDSELEGVTNLHISHARDISGLLRCPKLRILLLIGCDPVEMGSLTSLSSMVSLTVEDSGLHSLEGVQELPLFTLEISFNFLTNLAPAARVKPLKRINVTGNPLSPDSFYQVIPELRSRGIDVTSSGEEEWRITRMLHEAGLPYCYYRDDQGKFRISRPGLALTDRPEVNHPVIAPERLMELVTDQPSEVSELFERPDTQGG